MFASVMRRLFVFMLVSASVSSVWAQGFLRLPGNGQVHILELALDKDCTIRISVSDGLQGTLSSDKGHSIRFIAKADAATGAVKIVPIYPDKFRRGLVEIDGLRAGEAFDASADVPPQLAAGGLRGVKHVRSVTQEQFNDAKSRRDILMGAETDVRSGLRQVGAGENCCSFTGCNNTNWTFCTAGNSGCGADDCGGCCV